MSTLQAHLTGRQLLESEVRALFPTEDLTSLQKKPAIDNKTCMRCGNTKSYLFGSHPCAKCNKRCFYCRNCISVGKASACTSVLLWIEQPYKKSSPSEPILHWQGTLSPPQLRAAHLIKESIQSKKSILVHAVCGAGKTEILFPAIEQAMRLGLRICLATPRRDVVQELAPRLKQAFPTADIESLYGGSEDRLSFAHLTIATTNQLFRFRDAFDVMIIDEVDAYPYSADQSLQKAVENARKPDSSLIYLSATPSRNIKLDRIVRIPARYHGHQLPVPQTKWLGNWKKTIKKDKIDPALIKWLLAHPKALVFMPDVESMEHYSRILGIPSVHAEDPLRNEKVMQFRKGEVKVLLTTTILERGVTFSNVHVAVVGADEAVFTDSALVQIAGRVGRDQDFPTGNVTFFHCGLTNHMMRAIRQINSMNEEAGKLGLLKEGL
ncbi:DEAD/DEAH box helicase [Jeotgalibacillus sp. R-1-5s-1]|uniref:DEAD/DEAH box helicase n=1 Tax=Jeotgalibacillus sp. R-1-5s-1 TaxID=2555897 RepID=UPI001069C82B|nr:DEAD/DEAH box helicase [Jeotgalibacillus sp. R-1-5s-1]TFD95782.1 DEAD/DEAH box helicase [Jeotgalibacillus sp. R-1-5s-1]